MVGNWVKLTALASTNLSRRRADAARKRAVAFGGSDFGVGLLICIGINHHSALHLYLKKCEIAVAGSRG